MKVIVILLFLFSSLIDCNCLPIELTTKKLPALNTLGKVPSNTIVPGNAAKMAVPRDVEWIQPTTVRNQQQVLPSMTSTVGSIFELILAVRFEIHEKSQALQCTFKHIIYSRLQSVLVK